MINYIALILFAGLTAFIILLYRRRKSIEGGMTNFYQEYGLYQTTDEAPFVRESLGASNNLYCCRAKLTTAANANFEFGWWEWYITSNTMVNGVPSASFANYLAFSFAPNSVGDDFVQKALRFADKSGDSAAQKFKDFFVTDTQNPYRAEILADGGLLVCWRVTKQRDVYEAKIEWLKNNLSAFAQPETVAPKIIDDAQTIKPETTANIALVESQTPTTIAPTQPQFVESVARDETGIMRVDFYSHDNYAALQHRLQTGWANLDLELNYASAKFQHEGRDEMEAEKTFGDLQQPNRIAFTLDDKTLADEATRRFSDFSGGTAYILRAQLPVENAETLADCSHPFRLPLNEFTYAEFKRRFSTRWTNLSIELRRAAREDKPLQNTGELRADFEMKQLKNADKAFLHDYIYLYKWLDSLVYVGIKAVIRNEKLAVDCEGNFRNVKLKTFNEATSAESLRRMSI